MVRTPDAIDKIIGARLRQARVACHMTQADLAKTIGASFQQIQKYENGKNRVSSATLLNLAQALHVPIVYFYDGLTLGDKALRAYAVKNTSAIELLRFAKSKQGLLLLRRFLAVKSPRARQQILALLESLS
jgi:transcriptional regulator with XRE-family HTH domain